MEIDSIDTHAPDSPRFMFGPKDTCTPMGGMLRSRCLGLNLIAGAKMMEMNWFAHSRKLCGIKMLRYGRYLSHYPAMGFLIV